jgi:hypothetical protein
MTTDHVVESGDMALAKAQLEADGFERSAPLRSNGSGGGGGGSGSGKLSQGQAGYHVRT